jgi:hypothetical protein
MLDAQETSDAQPETMEVQMPLLNAQSELLDAQPATLDAPVHVKPPDGKSATLDSNPEIPGEHAPPLDRTSDPVDYNSEPADYTSETLAAEAPSTNSSRLPDSATQPRPAPFWHTPAPGVLAEEAALAKRMDIDLGMSALGALTSVTEEHALAKRDPASGTEKHLLPYCTNWFHTQAGTAVFGSQHVLAKSPLVAHGSDSQEGGASRYQDTLATSVDPESLDPRLIGSTRVC